MEQLREVRMKQAQGDAQPSAEEVVRASVDVQTEEIAEDDGFSSLDFEYFDFDDSDLLDYSQSPQTNAQKPSTPAVSHQTTRSLLLPETPVVLPQDVDLVNVILTWLLPKLENLLRTRYQALHDKQQQQQGRSTMTTNFAQYENNIIGVSTAMQRTGGRSNHSSNSHVVSTRLSSIASISRQGVWRMLGIHADCSLILVDQHKRKMEDAAMLFKRETWQSPWIQHWRLQDELFWATCVIENYPRMLLAYEDMFLNLWFSTVTFPLHELTTQHRFLHAILRSSYPTAACAGDTRGPTLMFSHDLFKDLPIAHLDHPGSRVPVFNPYLTDMDVDRSLMDTNLEEKLSHEFKEARLQVMAKVLNNMGDHYLAVKPLAGDTDERAYFQAHAVKSRYQTYLSLLLNQIKKDYEVLFKRRRSSQRACT